VIIITKKSKAQRVLPTKAFFAEKVFCPGISKPVTRNRGKNLEEEGEDMTKE